MVFRTPLDDFGPAPVRGSRRSPAVLVVVLLGTAVSVLGIVFVAAWQLRWTGLLRTGTVAWPITFNSALGLALTGGAVAALALGLHRLPLVAAGYDVAVGSITLVEYVMGRGLGIDHVFVRAYLAAPGDPPGRMAPTSALCWVLVGAGILGAAPWRQRRRSLWLSLPGAVVAAVAVVALFGHVAGLADADAWLSTKGMSLPTACGMAMLGSALMALGWIEARRVVERAQWWAFPAGLLALVLDVFLWRALAGGSAADAAYHEGSVRATTFLGLLLAVVVGVGVWLGRRAGAAAAALRESETRYRGMMDALGEGILIQDEAGRIVECNPAAERILGRRRGEPDGRTGIDPRWHAVHRNGSPLSPETDPPMVALRTGRSCRGVPGQGAPGRGRGTLAPGQQRTAHPPRGQRSVRGHLLVRGHHRRRPGS